MNIVVLLKLVPDLVEELAIEAGGASLDYDWLRLKLNEFDDHAIEEGLLLKERYGGQVTVFGFEDDSIDEILFTASAKGVDRLVKMSGVDTRKVGNHALMNLLAPAVRGLQPDLVLTGVQAHNDLDGPLGPLLAEGLGYPYIGYVSGVVAEKGGAIINKEFPGGLIAEMSVQLPAVLGIQSAEQPPRYVAFSKIRQAMKEATIDEQPAASTRGDGGVMVERMFRPESGTTAKMIEGSPEVVGDQLMSLFKELGII